MALAATCTGTGQALKVSCRGGRGAVCAVLYCRYYYDHERDRYPPAHGWRSQYHGIDPPPKIEVLKRHPHWEEIHDKYPSSS